MNNAQLILNLNMLLFKQIYYKNKFLQCFYKVKQIIMMTMNIKIIKIYLDLNI